jgi:hypothetical protein
MEPSLCDENDLTSGPVLPDMILPLCVVGAVFVAYM